MPAVVEGYQGLMRGLKAAEKDVRVGIRRELRDVARPVQATAETLAVERIRGLKQDAAWSKMRIGVTQTSVYVAPKQRGYRGRQSGRSQARWAADSKFGGLLMDRAMQPALDQHEAETMRGLERMLDRAADKFNRGI